MYNFSNCIAKGDYNLSKELDAKTIFVNSFKELMDLKDGPKINVTNLVEKSGLSRQTFYRYFDDIDDLIYFIHMENISISHKVIENFRDNNTAFKLYLDLMMQNQKFYQQIVSLDQYNHFSRLYFNKTKENLLKFMFENNENILNNKELMFTIDFYVYGFSSVVLEWIRNKIDLNSEELSRYLVENMPENLKNFLPESYD